MDLDSNLSITAFVERHDSTLSSVYTLHFVLVLAISPLQMYSRRHLDRHVEHFKHHSLA